VRANHIHNRVSKLLKSCSRAQDRWDESEMIIRGAMATCEHQQAVCSQNDILALGSALSELHVLRRQWNGARDVAIDVHDVLDSTSALKTSPSSVNISRLSSVAEAAMVRNRLFRSSSAFKSHNR
jgi:hypothetical protein